MISFLFDAKFNESEFLSAYHLVLIIYLAIPVKLNNLRKTQSISVCMNSCLYIEQISHRIAIGLIAKQFGGCEENARSLSIQI